MMRFIAVQWNAADAGSTQASDRVLRRLGQNLPGWQQVLRTRGMSVFCSATRQGMDRVYPLDGGTGVLVGRVFKTRRPTSGSGYRAVEVFSDAESDVIIEHGPQELIDGYWGWYVAFVSPREGAGATWVLRSPMSDLPCLQARYEDVNVFFSQAEDWVSLKLGQYSIDWVLLQLHVGLGEAALHGQSVIREISVLEGGEAFEVHDAVPHRRLYWNPARLARETWSDDPQLLQETLRETTRACVHAWASQHDGILVRLSGGFDSSVVLSCVADAPSKPRVAALNYFWEELEADERNYARAMADHAKVDLVESCLGTRQRLERVKLVTRTAAPITDVFDWQEREREQETARRYGATAVFTGVQGDALFQLRVEPASFYDYVVRNGLRKDAIKVAMDIGLRERVSVWKVFGAALHAAYLAPRRGPWNLYADALQSETTRFSRVLVADEGLETFRLNLIKHTHPWLRDVQGVPVGKLPQINELFSGSSYENQYRIPQQTRNVAPLLSQPLTELCLRIPSYRNVEGGAIRAVARRAFAQDLPQNVLRRSGKGRITPWLRTMLERDAQFVREFLLDGVLVEKGIIDREKLRRALPGDVSPMASHPGGSMDLLYAEAWARAWAAAPGPQAE